MGNRPTRSAGAERIARSASPKPKALKVFRTSIGFHDAYVAAPSKKAALEAWGSKKDLFARGAAELVEDPALTKAALASPGTVIKVSRGSVAEQLAALPKEPRGTPKSIKATAEKVSEPQPRPDRGALDAVEAKIDKLLKAQEKQIAEIARREAELAAEKRKLIASQKKDMAALEKQRDERRRAYDAAIKAWRG